MAFHEVKTCPRCQAHFECKGGSIAECQCSRVLISPQARFTIATNYSDCLCAACLQALSQVSERPENGF